MSDRRDLSEDLNATAGEAKERAAEERKAAEDQAFAAKLDKAITEPAHAMAAAGRAAGHTGRGDPLAGLERKEPGT